MQKKNIAGYVQELILPITSTLNLELVDVEFLKEAGNWYLRIYIDKDGGVSIDDCEAVSKRVGSILDEKDPIEQSYILEVSSPGLDRPLKRDEDFIKFKGKDVEVRLYKAIDGKKVFEGKLEGIIDNKIVIFDESGKINSFPKESVSIVKLSVKF